MPKIIAVLINDLVAKAGQALVKDESGRITPMDLDQMEVEWRTVPAAPFPPAPKPAPAPTPTPKEQPTKKPPAKRDRNRADAEDMLLRGLTVSMVAHTLGMSRNTITTYRKRMVSEGLLFDKNPKPRPHHFYRSAEALEKARQRGAALAAKKNKARGAAQ